MTVADRATVVLEKPSALKAAEALKIGLSRRRVAIIVGDCEVEYRGRASSMLESGERVVLIKDDGALLIHRPSGTEPVNWQSPGCTFKTSLSPDEKLIFEASHGAPPETVAISFNTVRLLAVLGLVDKGAFTLYTSEEDMRKAVFLEPSLVEEGFHPITYEKVVPTGFVDCIGKDRDGNFVVVEFKRERASRKAAEQLARYVETLRKGNPKVRGILVAPSLVSDARALLANLHLGFRRVTPKMCAEVLKAKGGLKRGRIIDYGEEKP